jgi:HlyD family secretion protein
MEQCEVEFNSAEAQLKQSKASLRTLLNGAKAEEIAAAEAQVENARASLQESESDLQDAAMLSPVEGIVSTISGAEGQRASANNNSTSGEGFLELISEALQLEAQVNESDIGQVKLGQKVEFTVNAYTDKVFSGRLSSIAPVAYAESNVQIYDVIIQLDNNYEELKAGMPADVTIIVEQKDDVLNIPKGAVTFATSYMRSLRQGSVTGAGPQVDAGDSDSNRGDEIDTNGKRDEAGAVTREQSGEQLGKSGQGDSSERGGEEKSASESKESGQGQRAMVLVKGKSGSPEPRPVRLGMSDLTNCEVINGLSEGETVITGLMSQSAAAASSAAGAGPSGGAMLRMGGSRTR